jgi:peroxiredoxin (alkyl hydroperoxide reductase subunit C)
MSAFVTKPAPDFTADAVVGGEFKTIKLSDFRGRYVVLFFYPLDFTFVCPTELIAFSDQMHEFTKRGAHVIGVSVDSKFSHLAWTQKPRKEGGLGNIGYPIVSDLNKAIARSYGVLLEETGVALRGLFLIDKQGILRHALVNDLPLGRSVAEAIRTLDALQHFEQHGEVCPANWKPGEDAMKADQHGLKRYFEKAM